MISIFPHYCKHTLLQNLWESMIVLCRAVSRAGLFDPPLPSCVSSSASLGKSLCAPHIFLSEKKEKVRALFHRVVTKIKCVHKCKMLKMIRGSRKQTQSITPPPIHFPVSGVAIINNPSILHWTCVPRLLHLGLFLSMIANLNYMSILKESDTSGHIGFQNVLPVYSSSSIVWKHIGGKIKAVLVATCSL